ncbi:hypothetical protein AA16663_1282 [Komagataeibacter rhaeticus DSM 16663]|nr:hypothetical protein AA16663_1282 [Komagataeibacter rhaeticus DSM 16663]
MDVAVNEAGQDVTVRHMRQGPHIGNHLIEHDAAGHDPVGQYEVAINVHVAAFPVLAGECVRNVLDHCGP